MPKFVIDNLKREGYSNLGAIADYIEVALPDGTEVGFVITRHGSTDGYKFEGDGFHYYWQMPPVDNQWDAAFRRHNTKEARPDGSFYPDEIGFDLVNHMNHKNSDCIACHYNGEHVTECGWRKVVDYQGNAVINGNRLSYYQDGATTAEAEFTLADVLKLWNDSFDHLPETPETARQPMSITEASVAELFPGYILRSHDSYNHGYKTEASYSRIKDGFLYIKRASFEVGKDKMNVVDVMPIPLSASLLKRLESETFDELLSVSDDMDVFLTEDALDLNRVPVPGVIVDSAAQENALILLTMIDQKTSRIHIVTLEGD